jgi:hypothetical protein
MTATLATVGVAGVSGPLAGATVGLLVCVALGTAVRTAVGVKVG